MADDVVAHAFSHGFHPQHVERLAAYWAEALGGPTTYSDSFGDETTVVRMHSGNGEHDEMDRRAIACFDHALADVGLANDGALRQAVHDYFAWVTTTTMSRYHQSADDVPNGLSIPRWSWTHSRCNTRRLTTKRLRRSRFRGKRGWPVRLMHFVLRNCGRLNGRHAPRVDSRFRAGCCGCAPRERAVLRQLLCQRLRFDPHSIRQLPSSSKGAAR
jgi:hemoglobin